MDPIRSALAGDKSFARRYLTVQAAYLTGMYATLIVTAFPSSVLATAIGVWVVAASVVLLIVGYFTMPTSVRHGFGWARMVFPFGLFSTALRSLGLPRGVAHIRTGLWVLWLLLVIAT